MSRNILCLNGEWDFMPIYGVKSCLSMPEKIVYEEEKIRVPSSWRYVIQEGTPFCKSGFGMVDEFQPFNMFQYPEKWSKADTALYRRTFTVSDDMLEGRVFLRFDGIMQTSCIYLNNKKVALWDEAYLPLKVDVTGFVKKDGSENELIVVCSTFEEVVTPLGQAKSLGLEGSWFGSLGRGIWQDVFLESCPGTYIDDIYIKTSFRNKNIETTVSITNKFTYSRNLDAEIIISDTNEIAKTIACKNIKIESDLSLTVHLADGWDDPELWMPDNPHLYEMKVLLYEDNREIDSKTVRFGFREVWMEGYKFIINSTRINLRGDSWHFQGAIQQNKEYALNWYLMCKENGRNCIRLHAEPYPEYYLEAADEAGILIMDETAIYGSGKSMDADHPVFIDRCKKHVERLVRRDRNHPSVVVWSLQNEMRWVDGRDVFKLYIPEMMQIIRESDSSLRPIILDGDNRLISKENAEIESMHYNVDGTIDQWEKKHPLFFGEHGGWWYICPQNSSAYTGLKAYLGFDECVSGIALKEKLFVEYARKKDVTGISTFNLVHYMMKSMPEEDVILEWDRLDTPGCKPKVLRKHSLTLNNGLLKDYPLYTPNASLEVLRDSHRAVAIIPSEYNSSFFDDKEIMRGFDIYNDTLHAQNCKVDITVSREEGEVIYQESFDFIQGPGVRESIHISFNPPKLVKPAKLLTEAVLYHNNVEMYKLKKTYRFYPGILKLQNIDTKGKSIVYWGGNESYNIISTLIPSCVQIDNPGEIISSKYDVVIVGSYVNARADAHQDVIGRYMEDGGVIVQLEQFKFAPGNLTLSKQPFFSAHINDSDHRILEGLTDDDFIFWKPYIREELPENIIEQCFRKPVKGDINILLECSAGDYGDGGDLWTPLVEYGYKKGTMILNQLELVDNFDSVPQVCLLLRNIIEYAVSLRTRRKSETALLAIAGSRIYEFIGKLGLEFNVISSESDFDPYKIIIADVNSIDENSLGKLSDFAKNGGRVVILPTQKDKEAILSNLLKCPVRISNIPTYQLNKTGNNDIVKGISIFDLFGFEKVNFSPRLVENHTICENTVEIQNGRNLLTSVNGTPWYDYYVRNIPDEYCRIALMDINKNRRSPNMPYLVEKQHGSGSFIVSQVWIDPENEKSIRIYSRILANLGGFLNSNMLSYHKGDRDYSVDYLMTLPHEECTDYQKAEEYYSDKDFSLNNLGEGLYGWMKKVEKDAQEGFINVHDSSGRTYFFTCFVDYIKGKYAGTSQPGPLKCKIEIDINCSFKLWINGSLVKEHCSTLPGIERVTVDDVVLISGLNRVVVMDKADGEDIKFRPIFKSVDGDYIDNIKYRSTIDEIEPK